MDDEQKALKSVDRSARAEALLKDELLQESFVTIDAELIDLWKRTKDPEARDRIWQATQIATKVQELLRGHIRNGKVAKAILNDIEGKRQRKAA